MPTTTEVTHLVQDCLRAKQYEQENVSAPVRIQAIAVHGPGVLGVQFSDGTRAAIQVTIESGGDQKWPRTST